MLIFGFAVVFADVWINHYCLLCEIFKQLKWTNGLNSEKVRKNNKE